MNPKNPREEISNLAEYVQGFADANQNPILSKAAQWLREAAGAVCAGGFFGCGGGDECTSDHK